MATAAQTTTAAPSTSAPPPSCLGDGALPAAADNHSLAAGDVDGDGLLDTIHTHTLGDPAVLGAWWVQISFASGGGTVFHLLDDSTIFSGAVPRDGMDIDGDGNDEFFVYLGGAGSEVQIFGLFDVPGCTIERVRYAGDRPSDPPATFTLTFGIICTDANSDGLIDSLVVDGGDFLGVFGEYTVTRQRLVFVGGVLEQRGSDVVIVPHDSLTNFGKIICDSAVSS